MNIRGEENGFHRHGVSDYTWLPKYARVLMCQAKKHSKLHGHAIMLMWAATLLRSCACAANNCIIDTDGRPLISPTVINMITKIYGLPVLHFDPRETLTIVLEWIGVHLLHRKNPVRAISDTIKALFAASTNPEVLMLAYQHLVEGT